MEHSEKYFTLSNVFLLNRANALKSLRMHFNCGLSRHSYSGFSYLDQETAEYIDVPFSSLSEEELVFLGFVPADVQTGVIEWEPVSIEEFIIANR